MAHIEIYQSQLANEWVDKFRVEPGATRKLPWLKLVGSELRLAQHPRVYGMTIV
jgi:hypothetical protein